MKKALLLPALVAAFPLAATAQTNVTLYGIADAAVDAADRGSSVGNSMQVFSGVQSTSRFGLRGSEDLGGGLKAVMNLEAGYSIDDGTSDASSSGLFQRRAVVGLEGGFGTVLLGRDYTPGYTLAQISDVMSYGLFGNLLAVQSPWGTSAGSSGAAQIAAPASNLGYASRVSNGVHYTSPSIAGGLRIRAVYASGERDVSTATVNKSAGNVMGLGASYASGPLSLQAYLHDIK
ncbi:MAG TPA: porin, partial [Quisquiliibacterium sp.]|nr:porin [Quisquiliibacterium sp.]